MLTGNGSKSDLPFTVEIIYMSPLELTAKRLENAKGLCEYFDSASSSFVSSTSANIETWILHMKQLRNSCVNSTELQDYYRSYSFHDSNLNIFQKLLQFLIHDFEAETNQHQNSVLNEENDSNKPSASSIDSARSITLQALVNLIAMNESSQASMFEVLVRSSDSFGEHLLSKTARRSTQIALYCIQLLYVATFASNERLQQLINSHRLLCLIFSFAMKPVSNSSSASASQDIDGDHYDELHSYLSFFVEIISEGGLFQRCFQQLHFGTPISLLVGDIYHPLVLKHVACDYNQNPLLIISAQQMYLINVLNDHIQQNIDFLDRFPSTDIVFLCDVTIEHTNNVLVLFSSISSMMEELKAHDLSSLEKWFQLRLTQCSISFDILSDIIVHFQERSIENPSLNSSFLNLVNMCSALLMHLTPSQGVRKGPLMNNQHSLISGLSPNVVPDNARSSFMRFLAVLSSKNEAFIEIFLANNDCLLPNSGITLVESENGSNEQSCRISNLYILLNQCVIDPRSPTIREWALMCIRNICEISEAARNAIGQLKQVHLNQAPELQALGVK
jgi:Spinocerebellar ataxia type 10 protein domain